MPTLAGVTLEPRSSVSDSLIAVVALLEQVHVRGGLVGTLGIESDDPATRAALLSGLVDVNPISSSDTGAVVEIVLTKSGRVLIEAATSAPRAFGEISALEF